MASTVFATHECPPPRDVYCSRSSSTSPLPWIPRRHASPHSPRRTSSPVSPLVDPLPSGAIFTRASLLTTLTSPNPSSASAPTPRPDFIDYTPSTPRPNTAQIMSRHLSVHAGPAAKNVHTPPLLRRKSGEPLKPSLKVKRTSSRGSLTVVTDPVNSSSSKSAPAAPAHKGVHFNSQLEHVKLFLPKQKPLAVSRDGYPTDTSGTDSEFSPIVCARDDDFRDRPLVMHPIEVPRPLPLAEDTCDVRVESIDLVGTTIEGVVRVRNLAFEKWIAARFTLDNWQTTSEVTARYKDTLQNGTFDRFMFAIKLADVLSRAEEKTLYLTVRYSVAGREIWDNNSGRNYQVRFVREKAPEVNKEAVVDGREKSPKADDIADLQHKLEQVVKLGCQSKKISGILAQESRRRWESPSPTPSPPPRNGTPSLKPEGVLSARYGVSASSHSSRCPPATHQTSSHARRNTYPSARVNSAQRPQSLPLPAPCGSPRDRAGDSYFPGLELDCDRDPEDTITLVPTLRRRNSTDSGSRNHTRGGCIDFLGAPGVKFTSPTSTSG